MQPSAHASKSKPTFPAYSTLSTSWSHSIPAASSHTLPQVAAAKSSNQDVVSRYHPQIACDTAGKTDSDQSGSFDDARPRALLEAWTDEERS